MKQNKTNESGRSMVEMLGVLAVIGVLSVGGVTGYRYAMEQIATNETLNILNKIWFGYLAESSKENSIIYSTEGTAGAASFGNPSDGSRQYSQYFCENYIGGDCKNFSYNALSIPQTKQKYAISPYWNSSDRLLFEVFISFSPTTCRSVLSYVKSTPEMMKNLRIAGWNISASLSTATDATIASYCDRIVGSMLNQDKKGTVFAFDFPNGYDTYKSDLD